MRKDFSTINQANRIGEMLPATSEMNNLLHTIPGTVKLLETIWNGDERAKK